MGNRDDGLYDGAEYQERDITIEITSRQHRWRSELIDWLVIKFIKKEKDDAKSCKE